MIIESLQKAIDVSKEKVGKIGKKLADTTTSGIIAAQKKLQNFLTNVKVDKGEKVAIASPDEKTG